MHVYTGDKQYKCELCDNQKSVPLIDTNLFTQEIHQISAKLRTAHAKCFLESTDSSGRTSHIRVRTEYTNQCDVTYVIQLFAFLLLNM